MYPSNFHLLNSNQPQKPICKVNTVFVDISKPCPVNAVTGFSICEAVVHHFEPVISDCPCVKDCTDNEKMMTL